MHGDIQELLCDEDRDKDHQTFRAMYDQITSFRMSVIGLLQLTITEALLGVIGIRDIWVKNYRDTGYLGGKLKGYGIFLKRFWDIED